MYMCIIRQLVELRYKIEMMIKMMISPFLITLCTGTQRSAVQCVEIIAGVVEDRYCNETKPDDKQRTCNEHQCPAT